MTPVSFASVLMRTSKVLCAALSLTFLAVAVAAADAAKTDASAPKSFNIPAGAAEETLKAFSDQSGRSVMFLPAKVQGIKTNAVQGDLSAEDAMDRLLSGTKLSAVPEKETGGFAIRREASVEVAEKNGSSRPASSRAADPVEGGVIKLETFEVMGSKLLNMDLPRSRDGTQPYIILTREKIEQSGATTINDFLKTRLPQNSVGASNSQISGRGAGGTSSINLRGLGANQTLILIDGRRAPASVSTFNDLLQPDLNGIPLAAVERIDILPTTASGIYGGGATGGVINIILRRDYAGVESKLTFGSTFGTDSSNRRIDLAMGCNLENGQTNILLSASLADQHSLAMWDRGFTQQYRNRLLANNPGSILQNEDGPPLGFTTNIISSNGSNLVLKNGATLNSPITYVPIGYAGFTTDGGAAFLANAGKYNIRWANSVQADGGGRNGLLNGAVNKALSATVRRQFGVKVQAFVDAGLTSNEARFPLSNVGASTFTLSSGAPNNPFSQNIAVRVPIPTNEESKTKSETYRATGGLILKLPRDWMVESDYAWSESHIDFSGSLAAPTALGTAISAGTLDVLRDTNVFSFDPSTYGAFTTQHTVRSPHTTLRDANLRTSGGIDLGWLPKLSLSGSIEHRSESISDGTFVYEGLNFGFIVPARSQVVDSAYLELHVPLVASSAISEAPMLELQMSGRRDDYATHGSTGLLFNPPPGTVIAHATNKVSSTDPTIALRFQPNKDLAFRASYGTGFLPPNVNQVLPVPSAVTSTVGRDPRRGNELVVLPAGSSITGGNPNLHPESSRNWSVGVVATPSFLQDLRVSLDWTCIDKNENILPFPGGLQALINNEQSFPSRFVRATPAINDPYGVGQITFLDSTLFNIARARVEAYDLQLDYRHANGSLGTFEIYSVATLQTHFKTQTFANQPYIENVGAGSTSPLRFKADFGLTWTHQKWTAGWATQFFDSYWVNNKHTFDVSQGSDRIASQVYHNVFVKYRFGVFRKGESRKNYLSNVELSAGIKNIFNSAPPFDASNADQGYYSFFGDPRLASYWVSLKKQF